MNAEGGPARTASARFCLLAVIAVILTGWALHATGAVMVPLVFSIFLALLVAPLDQRVTAMAPRRFGWLGHLAAMGTIMVVLLILVGLSWMAARQIVDRFPDPGSGSLLARIDEAVPDGAEADSGGGGEDAGDGGKQVAAPAGTIARLDRLASAAGESLFGRLGEWASGLASQVLSAAGRTLGASVLVFFLTLIMLVEAPDWRRKIDAMMDRSARRKSLESVGVIAERLRRFLLVRTALGVITAALYVAWLWLFGVDLLVVWALLVFLFNYVPALGSLIAGIAPVAYAAMQQDIGSAVAVGVGIFVIEQVMGNYVDPRVQGRQVSLSSLVVLVTLLVWGWIWGVAGTILAVPITIAAMIICAHVPALRPVALMLSNARDYEALDRQTSAPAG